MRTREKKVRIWAVLLFCAVAAMAFDIVMGSIAGAAVGGAVVGWALAWLIVAGRD